MSNMTDTTNEKYMSRKQLSAYLGICDRGVRKLTHAGTLPSIRLGKRVVYRMSTINKVLSDLEQVHPKAKQTPADQSKEVVSE